MPNNKAITVDEKVRVKNNNGKVYEDIALEFVSVRRHGKDDLPGWCCDPDKDCDYIAYAIAPLGKGWLLPTQRLHLAWERNKQSWLERYGQKKSSTTRDGLKCYDTLFCPVPPNEVMRAIGQTLRFQFDPVDPDSQL